MNIPPLGWTIDVASIAGASARFAFVASAEELNGLKHYLDVDDLALFASSVEVFALGGGKFRVAGTYEAALQQTSVVNLSPVSTRVDESFSVEYWPEELIAEPAEPLDFDADSPEPIQGGRIPIGALLCELLLLSLDPYPRNEGDTFEWSSSENEADGSAFSELASFRRLKEEK